MLTWHGRLQGLAVPNTRVVELRLGTAPCSRRRTVQSRSALLGREREREETACAAGLWKGCCVWLLGHAHFCSSRVSSHQQLDAVHFASANYAGIGFVEGTSAAVSLAAAIQCIFAMSVCSVGCIEIVEGGFGQCMHEPCERSCCIAILHSYSIILHACVKGRSPRNVLILAVLLCSWCALMHG